MIEREVYISNSNVGIFFAGWERDSWIILKSMKSCHGRRADYTYSRNRRYTILVVESDSLNSETYVDNIKC